MKWYHYLILLLILHFFCGCRTEYVPLEVVRHDSIMTEKLMRDSVYVRDSVYIQDKGDTVYKYRDKYIYVMKERTDTVYIDRERGVEIPVMIERKLSLWERVKISTGGVAIFVIAIWAVMKWIARRTRKE